MNDVEVSVKTNLKDARLGENIVKRSSTITIIAKQLYKNLMFLMINHLFFTLMK